MSRRSLQLRRWDPSTIEENSTILIIGKRGTGKSYLIRDILAHLRARLHFGVAFVKTRNTARRYAEVIPDTSIYHGFDVKVVERLTALQDLLSDMNQAIPVYLLMDDCMYDKKALKNEAMREVLMNGRNLKITYINAAQYVIDVGTDARSQIDYVIVCKEHSAEIREKLWRTYFGMFDRRADFDRVMEQCTNDREVLVLDNRTPNNAPNDCLYWYRAAENVSMAPMHSPQFRAIHLEFHEKPEARLKRRCERFAARFQGGAGSDGITTVEKLGTRKRRTKTTKKKAIEPLPDVANRQPRARARPVGALPSAPRTVDFENRHRLPPRRGEELRLVV